MMAQTVVITGFMGCGKSKVARALARSLDVLFVDLDESITARTGRTPAQLINEDGERAFRAIETETLRDVLHSRAAGVVALGGGAWIEAANRELIDEYSCASVWLDVPFEVCWTRIEAGDEDRPLGKTRDEALARYEHRRPVYELAKIHVPVLGHEEMEDILRMIEVNI
jgi:shikimate kinase